MSLGRTVVILADISMTVAASASSLPLPCFTLGITPGITHLTRITPHNLRCTLSKEILYPARAVTRTTAAVRPAIILRSGRVLAGGTRSYRDHRPIEV